MCKCSEKWRDVGPLVLRVIVGLVFLLHGWMKIQSPAGSTSQFFAQIGIPAAGFFAIIVTWLEFFGGIALILGIFTHWASKLLAIEMVVAIFTVHIGQGFFINPQRYGVEFALTLFGALVAIMAMGAGKYSLDAKVMKSHGEEQKM